VNCGQELCGNWTGHGCACAVLDLEPDLYNNDGSKRLPELDQEGQDEDDGD
jgi:hypothetical protein